MTKPVQKATTLIIKLGALGDFLLSLGPCEAIGRAYGNDRLILWTTPPFAQLAQDSGLFDEVWSIPRVRGWQMKKLIPWLREIKARGVVRIFDLQTSKHTSRFYYGLRLLGWRGDYSGIAWGASWRHDHPERNRMHTLDRQKDQLRKAHIADVPFPNLGFLEEKGAKSGTFGKDSVFFQRFSKIPYVLLVPGGSAHRLLKRWPMAHWKDLCERLLEQQIHPILVGGPDERELALHFDEFGLEVTNLMGQTSLAELAWIGKGARGAIGNDTGPMHLLALMGCPVVSLFSSEASDPNLCGPRGPHVEVLVSKRLDDLCVSTVMQRLDLLKEKGHKKTHPIEI